ncbi:hypothetical protein ABID21_001963 [Pseudorhizobium tarimense]|uniref:FecR protein domain-containing protein n=1 Tax=Pseudorhizobium tarimense TaxID=1079109 RepID=A0ABV2H5L8_9HYPH|nr:FecR domain-containing protein [Pseudorhizobium tarimense]MCJ8519051.1 FecR family protein [Pseudorhizobium tarimense]
MSYVIGHLLRVVALFVLFSCPALAGAQDWTVTRATKQVSYTVDKTTWHAVEAGSIIPNQAWISTGPRGRATLSRGTESITLQPNTLGAVITTQGLFSRKTDVVQQKGQIALNIEKRSRPHTFVHTPYLAAVVKGTTFTVTVTNRDASVSVEEGLVQVSSFTGGQSTNVGPGQQVTVDQAQEMSVAGVAEAPSVFSVEPTAASVPAVGQQAPVGAGLGLSSFSEQSVSSGRGGSESTGVSGESSDGGKAFGRQTAAGSNRSGGGNDNNGNSGNNGNGPNGNAHGKPDGNGNAGGNGNASNGGRNTGINGKNGGNGNSGNNGNGVSGGNGNGNSGNSSNGITGGSGGGAGEDSGTGNGKGNSGNGKGNGGGNGTGNEGNGNSKGGNDGD